MGLPRELAASLVSPEWAAQVVVVNAVFTNSTAADVTFPVFVTPRKMKFVKGTYVQSANATAVTSFTATVQVGTTKLSKDLDIKALAADTAAKLDPSATEEDRVVAADSIVDVVFDETGGTVTAPADVVVTLEFQLLE